MKQNHHKPQFPSIATKASKSIIALVVLFLSSFISCKKESSKNATPTPPSLQSEAMRVLKIYANTQEFDDMDWNNVQVSNSSSDDLLLRIKSKSDTSKVLLCTKKNGVIHVRWVKLNVDNLTHAGVITVSSLNEIRIKELSFNNGRIYASHLTLKSKTTSESLSSQTKSVGIKSPAVSTSRTFAADGNTEEPIDDGDYDSGDDGGGSSDGGGSGDSGSSDDGSESTGTASTSSSNPDGSTGTMSTGFTLPVVVVTGTGNSPTYYSLYYLLGDNTAYLYEYTTNPKATTGSIGTVITIPPANIVDKLKDPCLITVLNKLINNNLSGKIANIINNVFGSSANVNLTFVENDNTTPTQTALPTYSGGVYNETITLNLPQLQEASQEYKAIIIVHEILHAYMNYNNDNYGLQLEQHQAMAQNYVNDIKAFVQSLYPTLSDADAYAIILNGMADVYNNDPTAYQAVLNSFKTNQADYELQKQGIEGTPCSN